MHKHLLIWLTAVGALALDINLPALPLIGRQFGLAVPATQGTLVLFVAGMATAHLLWDWAASQLGARSMLLWAGALLTLGSLLCANAHGLSSLLAGRLLQGVGAGGAAALAPLLLRQRGDMTSSIVATLLPPVLGPALGALLLLHGDWRTTFLLVACASTLLLPLAGTFPKGSAEATARSDFGFARLLRNGDYLRYACCQALCFGAGLAFAAAIPFLVNVELRLEPRHIAMLLACGALGQAGGVAIIHYYRFRHGALGMLVGGIILEWVAVNGLLVLAFEYDYTIIMLACAWFVLGLGMGMRATPTIAGALKAAGQDARAGMALLMFLCYACAAVAIWHTAHLLETARLAGVAGLMGVMVMVGTMLPPALNWSGRRSA
jgi:DHA1 family bicyclomycin/chloramphenicol resistance-like MFS transporter